MEGTSQGLQREINVKYKILTFFRNFVEKVLFVSNSLCQQLQRICFRFY